MYVMKGGVAVGKFKVTEVDSVVFYKPATASNTVIDVEKLKSPILFAGNDTTAYRDPAIL